MTERKLVRNERDMLFDVITNHIQGERFDALDLDVKNWYHCEENRLAHVARLELELESKRKELANIDKSYREAEKDEKRRYEESLRESGHDEDAPLRPAERHRRKYSRLMSRSAGIFSYQKIL